ncbi:SusD/RagB family nutrient-binding outer membrane lipoprotein [Winogradskyella schleiferi]|uniref:SusD/RagB family nutrient-binding outer membrane lipoprotein n=1 Tax=Winogradskyella schleiferi TaxID=2686078 RepID=UPI0015B96C40|nr:SusD/RagB family nutrient-binding outer membrane lipoprotein [Winogradskyella schleiferi]
MKKIIYILIGFTLITSCEKELDINRDPDAIAPSQLALNVELPASITGIAGAQGAPYALIGGFWSQYWTQSNAANQYRLLDNYNLGTTDGIQSGAWNAMYDGLLDVRNVKNNAAAAENWNYYLIATVLEAYGSQLLTDFYGAIPYSQANDQEFLQPIFDSGPDVYDLMIADLDDALSRNLNASNGLVPGADDLVFGGDMSNWVKFANTLKLKIYLRQTEARPGVASAGISAMINSGTQFLDTDAALTGFTDAPNLSNPLFESDRRQLNVGTNLRASTTMYSFLDTNGDERLSEFYGAGNPLNQGDFNNTEIDPTSISVVNLSPTTPVYFISWEESLFLQAEAMVRYNGGSGAEDLYNAAVQESFNKWGIDGSTYVNGGVYDYAGGSMEAQIEDIITQKWVASFPGNGAEAFFEWHRTGYPNTSSVAQDDVAYVPGEIVYSIEGTTGGVFPQRIEYPNTELSRNSNAPELESITSPIWWNQ